MTDDAKIMFSDAEKQLLADTNLILTKLSVITKVEQLFGVLGMFFQTSAEPLLIFLPEVMGPQPKISKGEKYQLMPWVMLDYPRCFDKVNGQFAIRCFFWWGNYFSMQLQLSGAYKKKVLNFLNQYPESRLPNDWQTGLTEDAWDYALPNEKWLKIDWKNQDHLTLKMAKRFEFDQIDQLKPIMEAAFEELIDFLKIIFTPQADEINL